MLELLGGSNWMLDLACWCVVLRKTLVLTIYRGKCGDSLVTSLAFTGAISLGLEFY